MTDYANGIDPCHWSDLKPTGGDDLSKAGILLRIYAIQVKEPVELFKLGGRLDIPKSKPDFTTLLRLEQPDAKLFVLPPARLGLNENASVSLGALPGDEQSLLPERCYFLKAEVKILRVEGSSVSFRVKILYCRTSRVFSKELPSRFLGNFGCIKGTIEDEIELSQGRPAILSLPPFDGTAACVLELTARR